jgi:hypothetical protein
MTEQSPITPSPELARQWRRTAPHPSNEHEHYYYITLCAAQWGADQELEACVQWTIDTPAYQTTPGALRAARRPKPPSLKQQARSELIDAYNAGQIDDSTYDTIRRALEALPDD